MLGQEVSAGPMREFIAPAVSAGLANGYVYVLAIDGEFVVDPATGGRRALARDHDTDWVTAEPDDLLVLDDEAWGGEGILVIDTSNWTVEPMRPPTEDRFTAISQRPGDARIWAIAGDPGDLSRGGNQRLFYTDDGGGRWVSVVLPEDVGAGRVTAAASGGRIAVRASRSHRMFVSDDAGENWTAVPLPISGSLHSLAGGRLLINGGFLSQMVSTDRTWHDFATLPSNIGTARVATSGALLSTGSTDVPPPNRHQMQVSWDGGSTWTPVPISR
jgi:hypothetical protein